MELKAKEGPVAVSHRLDVAVLGAREGHEVPRELGDLVVVGLPHLEPVRETFEEDVGLVDLHDGLAELWNLGRSCVASEMLCHELVPRADSEDRRVERVQVLPVPAHLSRIHPDPGSAAGQHEPVQAVQLRNLRVVRDDLRVGAEVLQDPPLAMSPLAPVVDDVDTHGSPVAAQ